MKSGKIVSAISFKSVYLVDCGLKKSEVFSPQWDQFPDDSGTNMLHKTLNPTGDNPHFQLMRKGGFIKFNSENLDTYTDGNKPLLLLVDDEIDKSAAKLLRFKDNYNKNLSKIDAYSIKRLAHLCTLKELALSDKIQREEGWDLRYTLQTFVRDRFNSSQSIKYKKLYDEFYSKVIVLKKDVLPQLQSYTSEAFSRMVKSVK